MRVYEFARKQNISSKKIIELLQKTGFDVTSHMSVLEDKALLYLEKAFKKPEKAAKPKVPKKEKTIEIKKILEKPPKKPVPPKPKKKDIVPLEEKLPKKIQIIAEPMRLVEFAKKINMPATEIIVTLLKWGIVAPKNQVISVNIVTRLAGHYDIEIVKPEAKQEKVEKKVIVAEGELKERLPVIVILGHVDHGKTTLLDFIRKTRIAIKEKGGITQHLGAYEATTSQGSVVFLDTPGHEAFSKMRQRGVKVADIAVLVVAADDGVMPQTVEAIKHAKSINIPIIVAINKIDKVDKSRIEVVKRQLSQHDVLPEEWGGDAICVPISAKLGTGVDQLLEMILLQSQMMELRADLSGPAKGYVLESKLEKGRGPVATLIAQHGALKVGDYFVCGITRGRVNSLVDSYGKRLNEVGPVIPVQAAGFYSLPEVGDFFKVVSKNEFNKAAKQGEQKLAADKRLVQEGGINIIIKTDTNSTKEALIDAIEKLSKRVETPFNIIHAAVGDVSESNVEFAFNTGSNIIGLHVKKETNAASLAQRREVSIDLHTIIYKLLEDLEERSAKTKEVEMVLTKIGEAVVLKIFDIKKIGVIAGAYVKDGRFSRDGTVKVWRGSQLVGEGKITSLQRERKTVKEVHSGFECGFMVEKFTEWGVDDRVECYIEVLSTP